MNKTENTINRKTGSNQVCVFLTQPQLELSSLSQTILKTHFVEQFKDALKISFPQSHAIVFDYGVVVTWNVSQDKLDWLKRTISPENSRSVHESKSEYYSFSIDAQKPIAVKNDHIWIPDQKVLTLLTVSHALAQSAKLEQFETLTEKLTAENRYLAESLRENGSIPLSRKQLAKLRGKLFQTKSDILLRYDLLDTPEFFWEHPEMEGDYLRLANYFELKSRVDLLTLKLQTIQDLIEVLASERNHSHSAFLEWIIIILIAVDILVYFKP